MSSDDIPISFRNQIIDLRPIKQKLGIVSAQFQQSNTLLTGIDYIPPLNAEAKISIKIRTKRETNQVLAGGSRTKVSQVPDAFSWRKTGDIKTIQGWKTVPAKLLSDPPNQYGCGSCYAISSATMLADRYAIFQQKSHQPLSATYILSCLPRTKKCDGGYPGTVGKFLESQGTTTLSCYDYSWCANNDNCKNGLGTAMNPYVPGCIDQGNNCQHSCSPGPRHTSQCSRSGTPQFFRCKQNSTQALVRPRDIQIDILRYGPVVAVFRVFGDFTIGPIKDKWAKTDGIYMHIENKDLYGYGKIACGGQEKDASQCYMGNHAVVIVGWGKSPKGVSYWIVRNSWGTHWNGDGYFKIAFSDPEKGINTEVALDRPLHIGNSFFGGATTFRPNIPMAFEGYVTETSEASSTAAGNSISARQRIVFVFKLTLVLFVLFVIYLLWRRKLRPKTIR